MEGKDELRISTNIAEIVERHNKYFVPVWKELMDKGSPQEGQEPRL